MAKEFATRLLRWDIDWSYLTITLVLTSVIFYGTYPFGIGGAAFLTALMLICCMVAVRPRFIVRWCCVPRLRLGESETVALRVAAILQEFPQEPFVRRMFPPCTGGWVYLTNRRLAFHGRRRSISFPFGRIQGIYSDPPRRRWWWWIYANAGRIHVQTADGVVTIRVRYSHLLRREIEAEMKRGGFCGATSGPVFAEIAGAPSASKWKTRVGREGRNGGDRRNEGDRSQFSGRVIMLIDAVDPNSAYAFAYL